MGLKDGFSDRQAPCRPVGAFSLVGFGWNNLVVCLADAMSAGGAFFSCRFRLERLGRVRVVSVVAVVRDSSSSSRGCDGDGS